MPGEVASSRFITRDARRDDYEHFVMFWGELGLDHPPPKVDDWDRLLRGRTIFLEDAGQVVAYGLSFAFGERGDVRQVAVAPAARRTGAGKALMHALAERFRATGVTNWRLEVRRNNAPAVGLYRAVGMDVIRNMVTIRMPAQVARDFALTRSGALKVELVDPKDDAALEHRWDLGRGQLERWRGARGPNARLWRIGDRALAQYTPDFAPTWGLVFPLHAIDRGHAAHIFGAVVETGLRDDVESQLEDGLVSEALVRAGARVTDELFEMGGVLPPAL